MKNTLSHFFRLGFLTVISLFIHLQKTDAQGFNKTYPNIGNFWFNKLSETNDEMSLHLKDGSGISGIILTVDSLGNEVSLTDNAPPFFNPSNVPYRIRLGDYEYLVGFQNGPINNEINIRKLIFQPGDATTYTIEFEKTYTFNEGDLANFSGSSLVNEAGEIFILGSKKLTVGGNNVFSFWVLKLDADGNEIWRYESSPPSIPQQTLNRKLLQFTKDGGCLVQLFGYGSSEYLVKLDAEGNFVFEAEIDTPNEQFRGVREHSDGSFEVLVYTVGSNLSNFIYQIKRFDANGNYLSTLTPGIDVSDYFDTAILGVQALAFNTTNDGGIIVAGRVQISGNYFFYLLKYNADGTLAWLQRQDDFLPYANNITQTADEGFLISGFLNNVFWLLKTDALGNYSNANNFTDLELSITSPNPNPGNLQSTTLTATLINNSDLTATDVRVLFTPHSNISITEPPVTSQGVTADWWTGVVRWNLPTLAAHDTATLDLSVYLSSENMPFYGEIIKTIEPDSDSQPNNGNMPNVSEDDEAIIFMNETQNNFCDMTVLVSNIQCLDNGSPQDVTDDLVQFNITPQSPNNPNGTWFADGFGLTNGAVTLSGNYGESATLTTLMLNYPDGIMQFTVVNEGSLVCSEDVAVLLPPVCSSADNCQDNPIVSNIVCYDTGTPNDPTDDTWSFDFTVEGPDDYNWQIGSNNQIFGGNPNETVSLGLFDLANGDKTFSLIYLKNTFTACSKIITVVAPEACSVGGVCESNAVISNINCHNQNTVETEDDTFDFTFEIIGENAADSFLLTGNLPQPLTLAYGEAYEFTDYLIADGELNFIITDTENPDCVSNFQVTPPPPCSNSVNGPDIELSMTSLSTPGAYTITTFLITVVNNGNSDATNLAIKVPTPADVVPQGGNEYSATAGETSSFGGVYWELATLASNQTETLTVNYFTLTADPTTCYAQVTEMDEADEDSTPYNGTNPIVNEDDEAVFTTGMPVVGTNLPSLRPRDWFLGLPNPLQVGEVYPINFNVENTQAPMTAASCHIGFYLSTDKFYDATDIFIGEATADNFGPPPFIQSISSSFVIDELPMSTAKYILIFVDDLMEIEEFNEMSNVLSSNIAFGIEDSGNCQISPTITNLVCENNQTSDDATDDFFSFELLVNGNNASDNWTTEVNGNTETGDYGSSTTFENLLIANGAFELTITDANDAACQQIITVTPPPTCSNNGGNPTGADLELSMTSSSQPGAYQNVSFQVTVTNTGDEPMAQFVVQTLVPTGVVWQGGNEFQATGGQPGYGGIVGPIALDWTLSDFQPGQTETLTLNYFTLTADPITAYTQVLSMNSDDADSESGNGTPPIANEDDEAAFTLGQPVMVNEYDFVPSNLQIDVPTQTILLPETVYDISYNMLNDGNANTGILTKVGLYLSLDNVLDNNDIYLHDFPYGPIAPNILLTEFTTFSIPNTVAPQSYFLILEADYLQQISETNENNNSVATSIPFVFQNDDFSNCVLSTHIETFTCISTGLPPDYFQEYTFSISVAGQNAGTGWTATEINTNETFSGNYDLEVDAPDFYVYEDGNRLYEIVDNEDPNCQTTFEFIPPVDCSNPTDGVDIELDISAISAYGQWQNVSFEIPVTNVGGEDASGLVIEIFPPAGGVFVGGNEGIVTAGTFASNGSLGTWTLPNLAAGATEILTLNVFVLAANEVTIFAEVHAMNELDVDSSPNSFNPNNGTATEDDEFAFVFSNTSNLQINNGANTANHSTNFILQQLYPNPVSDVLHLKMESQKEGLATLQLLNLQGSILKETNLEMVIGRNTFVVGVADLPNGVYFVSIQNGDLRVMERFVKE